MPAALDGIRRQGSHLIIEREGLLPQKSAALLLARCAMCIFRPVNTGWWEPARFGPFRDTTVGASRWPGLSPVSEGKANNRA